jgi:hypothetical protein
MTTTFPNNDTDQAGYLITTEFGKATFGNYNLAAVAPFVYGTVTFEGDTVVAPDTISEGGPEDGVVVAPEASVDEAPESVVVAPDSVEDATVSDPFAGFLTHVKHDAEDVKDDAEHDADVVVHDAEDVGHDVETHVENAVHDAEAIKDIPEVIAEVEADFKEVETVLHDLEPAPTADPVVAPTDTEV